MARSTSPGRETARDATRSGRSAREELAHLLALAAGGDTAAFMRFYDLTCPAAYRAALALCGDQERAEDLASAWYARAWADAPAYPRSGLSPVAWLLAGITQPARSHAAAAGTWPEPRTEPRTEPWTEPWARGA